MLGFFFTELKRYVTEDLSPTAWIEILGKAGLGSKNYMNGLSYPDEELRRIVVGASTMTGMPVEHVLREFGRYVGRDLFSAYRPLIDPEWRTLDFLENVEETIHKVVRARNRKAGPPRLVCNRLTEREIVIDYRSDLKLCHIAQGIARGVSDHYGEKIEIVEETCMHRGDASCKIWVSLAKPESTEDEDLWDENDDGSSDDGPKGDS